MKPQLLKFGILMLLISLISCDGETGMDGIVQDSVTGERLSGVKVEMISNYKHINVMTDSTGWFFTKHSYSCGIKKCDESFSIKFEKDKYDLLELDENYYSATAYVDSRNKDSIIVKLTHLNKSR
jgi:hypothetical protein